MAQQNVVPSLFGLTPELYQQNRLADLQAQQTIAARTAAGPGTMLNPSLAPLYARAAQRGQLEGEALRAVGGLLGVEDPELRKIRDVQQMRSQFDVSTPEGLRSFAQALSAKGYSDLALQAANEADRRTKISSEAQMAEQKISQEKKLREEIAKLGDNPTEEQYLQVFRKFGNPDQQARAIEMGIARRERLAAKQPQPLSPEQVAAKQQDAQIAVDTVSDARALISDWKSTGFGSMLSFIPTTDARKLQGKLDTIKSNLAAAMIEDLKSQSKTGATGLGALNREELKVLQTSKASLDAGMGADELNKSLNVIDKYFRARANLPPLPKEPSGNKKTSDGKWSIIPDGSITSGSSTAVQVPK